MITAYSASASYGATPAYIAWKPKIRCSRSSSKNDATLRPRRPNPPSRTSRLPARQWRTRSSAESKSASMKLGISTRYSSVSQSAKRPNDAASAGPGELADLLGHRLAPVADVEHGPVGVRGPVHRIDRAQRDVVGHVGAGGGEHVGQQARHRQHGRPVVEPEPGPLDHPGPAARAGVALEDEHVVAVADQVGGGGQPAEAGADDDDLHQTSRVGDERGQGDELVPWPRR